MVCVLQLPQVDVLDGGLEGAQTVAEFIFTGVAEAEVPDVAQVGHPEDKQQNNSLIKYLYDDTVPPAIFQCLSDIRQDRDQRTL